MKKILKYVVSVCLVAFLWLSPSQPVFAAYAFVQSAQAQSSVDGGVGQNLSVGPITVTAGNTLIIWMVTYDSTNAALSGNSNTYTNAGIESPAFGGAVIMAYYCQNANSGATTITRSGGDIAAIYVAEYSGLATSGGLAGAFVTNPQAGGPGTATNAVTSGNVNVTVAPTAQFGMAVDGQIQSPITQGNTTSINPGTGYTGRGSWTGVSARTLSLFEDVRVTGTGNSAATFTLVGNKGGEDWHSASFALPELGGAPPKPPRMMLMGVTKLINHKPAVNDAKFSHKRAA